MTIHLKAPSGTGALAMCGQRLAFNEDGLSTDPELVTCPDCKTKADTFKQKSIPLAPIPPSPRGEILNAAHDAISGERQLNYGLPEDSFERIAELWSAYCGEDIEFAAADVAMMMALVKIARLRNNPKHKDSWVDLAGYAACGGEIAMKAI